MFSINGNLRVWKQLFREKLEYISKYFAYSVIFVWVRLNGRVSIIAKIIWRILIGRLTNSQIIF